MAEVGRWTLLPDMRSGKARQEAGYSSGGSMTAHPFRGKGSGHAASTPAPTDVARWAVGLAAVATAVVLVSYAVVGVAYAIGGTPAIEDNWVGLLGAVSLAVGLALSLFAFALAVAAKVKQQRWARLWLPLSILPTLVTLVLFTELFWLE